MIVLGRSQATLSHNFCDKFGDLHEPIKMNQESSFTLRLPKKYVEVVT